MMNKNIENPENIYVVLLCGIPGVGKTFFSSYFRTQFNSGNVIYFNFDELFYENAKTNNMFYSLDLTKFKITRNEFFSLFKNKLEELITANSSLSNTNIFLIDDNFYFKSMRKPYYKLCKLKGISYSEIHFQSSIDYCLKMNSKRVTPFQKIPEEIIDKINENFQWNSFNKSFIYEILIEDMDSISKINIKDLIQHFENNRHLIININVKEHLDKLENIKINKKENKALFIDKLEIEMRKKVGEIIKSSNSSKINPKEISISKKEFMNLIKSLLYKNFTTNNNNISVYNDINNILQIQLLIEKIKEESYQFKYIDELVSLFKNQFIS
jgi:tRNA uridine 5-carbamoylmethylation protein Kti12